jgi:2,4-dienoyl-CoA reductase-like NADH-dependent reductase (Old Yellow Enzyme family)
VFSSTVQKYLNLAKGGFGAIITGFQVIDEREKNINIFQIWNDDQIKEAQKIINAVHSGIILTLKLILIC